ncbi:MAG: restriction endonuclease subunit S [Porticoccaceae bacterium]|nr:restriction endonuclease subunit S [Porticoccaceae bacterium]
MSPEQNRSTDANPITDHLDLWSSATKKKATVGRGKNRKISPHGINKLRELILELAVRGKLVPQDPKAEQASVLLEKIADEKARLVKGGEIRKLNPLPPISNEDKPFSLPSGWEWVRLGAVGETNIGLTYKPAHVGDIGIPVLRSSNIQKGKIDLNDLVRVDGPDIKPKAMVELGDLLICARNGSKALVGKTAMIKELREPMAFGAFMAIFRSQANIFIEIFLNSPVFRRNLGGVDTTTINQITQNNLKNTIAPIPPQLEQHRIVAKVDELMALCDQLEQQQTDSLHAHQILVRVFLDRMVDNANTRQPIHTELIAAFDTLFTTEEAIDQLKQTILQLAVMGKLVPQNPNDEPASVLLEKIAAEKQQLIKDKKIKKQKPLPPISDEEKPFDLPEGWEWVKFGLLAQFINGDRGKNYPNKNEYVGNGVPWINTGHIEPTGLLTTIDMNYITREKYDALRSGKIQNGDLVYCLRGATFGKTAFVVPYKEGAIASSLMIIRPYIRELVSYIFKYLVSPYGKRQLLRFDNGSAQPNLSANNVMLYAFPLPPLAEQLRIVTKVDELMILCDTFKARLNEAQTTQAQLADAVVEQAVG